MVLSWNVYLFPEGFYLLIFGTAQQDLTGCGTGILGVVLVERGTAYQAGLGKQGWLAQLGSGTDSADLSRGTVNSGQFKPQRPHCPTVL